MITATVGTLTRTRPVQIGSVLSSREPLGCTIATTCECTEGEPTSGIMVGIRTRKRRLHLPQPSIAGETEPCTDVESTPCDCSPALTPPVVPTIACGLRYSKARYTFNVPFTVSTTTSCAGQFCSCRWTLVECDVENIVSPMRYTMTAFSFLKQYDVVFCVQSGLKRVTQEQWTNDSGERFSLSFCQEEGLAIAHGLNNSSAIGIEIDPTDLPLRTSRFSSGGLSDYLSVFVIVEAGDSSSYDPDIFNSSDPVTEPSYRQTGIDPEEDNAATLFKYNDVCYKGTFVYPAFPESPYECDMRKVGGTWLLTTGPIGFTPPYNWMNMIYGTEDGGEITFTLPITGEILTLAPALTSGTVFPASTDFQQGMLIKVEVSAPYYVSQRYFLPSEGFDATDDLPQPTAYIFRKVNEFVGHAQFYLRSTVSDFEQEFVVKLWYNGTTPTIVMSANPPGTQITPDSYSDSPQTYVFSTTVAGVPITITGVAYAGEDNT